MASAYLDIRHRKGCRAKGRDWRNCSCSPGVRASVNRVYQPDLGGVLNKGWRKRDLDELELALGQRALDHDSGRRVIERAVAPTVGELAEAYLADVRRAYADGDYAANTVKGHESNWRALLEPEVGHERVTAIDANRVADLRSKLLADGRARSYVTTAVGLLSAILADKAVPTWLPANPCAVRRKQGRARVQPRQPRALSVEFVNLLLDAALTTEFERPYNGPLLHDMILCAVTTGMRQREVAGLKWTEVNFRDHQIEVASQLTAAQPGLEEAPKSKRSRITVMCNPLAERLRTRKEAAASPYVFGRGERDPWGPIRQTRLLNNVWESVGDRNKGESWHALRHTFASLLDRNRIRPIVIDALMGHKNHDVSFRYQHVFFDELAEVVEVLDREFNRTHPGVVRLSDRRAS